MFRSQRRDVDGVTLGKIDVELDAVFKLTHIAGPAVCGKMGGGIFREGEWAAFGGYGKLSGEETREEERVVAAFAERGDAQSEGVEPVEEIPPEPPMPGELP